MIQDDTCSRVGPNALCAKRYCARAILSYIQLASVDGITPATTDSAIKFLVSIYYVVNRVYATMLRLSSFDP